MLAGPVQQADYIVSSLSSRTKEVEMLQIMEKRLVIVRDAWNAVQRYCDNSHESIKTHQSSASFVT